MHAARRLGVQSAGWGAWRVRVTLIVWQVHLMGLEQRLRQEFQTQVKAAGLCVCVYEYVYVSM